MASASVIAAIIRAQFAAGPHNAICVLGEPGIGKTAIQEQVFLDPELKFDAMKAFNASFRDVVDFLGTPTHQPDQTTKWFPPNDLVELADGRRWLLVLEEITDCDIPVQNALCRLIHEREINGVKLGDNVYILCNGNLSKHKSGAKSLITKLSNRMTVVEMEANFEVWKNEFALPLCDKIPSLPIGIAYLNFQPGNFCDFKPAEMVSATPRSWMRAFETPNMPPEAYFQKIAGDVGLDKATTFIAFRDLYLSLPKISDILADPKGANVPKETNVQYALAGALSHHATPKNFDDVLTYVGRFPTKDLEVVCVMDAVNRDKGLTSTRAFSDWAIKNVGVFS